MHLSTRILLLLFAIFLIGGGWWILLANNALVAGLIYGAIWTALVLVATRVLLAFGFRYNRFAAGRDAGRETDRGSESALSELIRLRDAGLISPAEYEDKRARIVERL